MRALVVTAVLALTGGCSLVNDPSAHVGGGVMDGGAVDGGADGGPPAIPANEFCARFAQFACDGLFDCCPSAPDPSDVNRQRCLEQAEFDCTSGYGSLIADSRTGYDPVVAAEVIAEGYGFIEDATACDLAIADWYLSRSGFQRVLQGTVGGGGTCTPRSLEFSDPDVAAFFSCESREQACFFMSSERWFCGDRQSVGGDCVFYFDCVDGLRCARDPLQLVGTCQERVPDGGVCGDGTDCESTVCETSVCRERTAAIYCGLQEGPPGG